MSDLKEKEVGFISELLTNEETLRAKCDIFAHSCHDEELCELISSISAKCLAREQALLGCLK